ncbi:hypothetical protein A3Q56_02671 [Intoshia linei]|uniref:Uncharacterized protein n=1 Tax=Intoshia linei TaxID=1819745 RepID=A0A177B5Q7_9BILA|nr:hypothetical protein A3Q56_02671 [Intoshia linei]
MKIDVCVLKKLSKLKICLASSSPRRKEILEKLNLKFEIVSSNYEDRAFEKIDDPIDYVLDRAEGKLDDVLSNGNKWDIVISADTIVIKDEIIYEKPTDATDALRILKSLNNRQHKVVTAVCIATKYEKIKFHEITQVYFSNFTEEFLQEYIESGEYVGKAGGYGIQGYGAILIEKIIGDYYNVVGFPINAIIRNLKQLNF